MKKYIVVVELLYPEVNKKDLAFYKIMASSELAARLSAEQYYKMKWENDEDVLDVDYKNFTFAFKKGNMTIYVKEFKDSCFCEKKSPEEPKITLKEYLESPKSQFDLFLGREFEDLDIEEVHLEEMEKVFVDEDPNECDWDDLAIQMRNWLKRIEA